jgi:hypothetical protein
VDHRRIHLRDLRLTVHAFSKKGLGTQEGPNQQHQEEEEEEEVSRRKFPFLQPLE